MTSKTINIKVPADISERKVKIRLAADLYKDGEITLKQAADLAEISLWDFLHELGKINISFTNISLEDLKQEIEDLT
jgi:predicted HTH domain antitoxin